MQRWLEVESRQAWCEAAKLLSPRLPDDLLSVVRRCL
jgi:hypothetical protein